jgi:integrase
VWPSGQGTPVSETRFRLAFKKLIKDAGVKDIRLYDTRSTYVSLSDGKVTDVAGAARAGHSIQVRRDIYKRSVEEEEKAAALSLKELTADNRRRKKKT